MKWELYDKLTKKEKEEYKYKDEYSTVSIIFLLPGFILFTASFIIGGLIDIGFAVKISLIVITLIGILFINSCLKNIYNSYKFYKIAKSRGK